MSSYNFLSTMLLPLKVTHIWIMLIRISICEYSYLTLWFLTTLAIQLRSELEACLVLKWPNTAQLLNGLLFCPTAKQTQVQGAKITCLSSHGGFGIFSTGYQCRKWVLYAECENLMKSATKKKYIIIVNPDLFLFVSKASNILLG